MATSINQIDDDIERVTTLRVEGELMACDAQLLEKIARDARESTGYTIVIDVADLDFMDSESAPILRRMENDGVRIQGVEIFLQTAINDAERYSI